MTRPLQPHGTPAAWKRHQRAHEPACQPCLTAHAQANNDRLMAPQRRAILAEAIAATDGRTRRKRRRNPDTTPLTSAQELDVCEAIDPGDSYERRREYLDSL